MNIFKSKIVIVNRKDEIMGYKERGTLNQPDIYRVSVLWIQNSKGEILLAQRALNKKIILEKGVRLLLELLMKENLMNQILSKKLKKKLV